jgi:non-specific protein-tyrosine kinase
MTTAQLITLTEPKSAAAEAYRTLRTNLLFSTIDKPVNTLVFTSPTPETGKSTAIANLAVTLAQGGHETILVDCDLRRPQQHTFWNISNDKGLTTMMLEAGVLAQPPLQQVGVPNLLVLPSASFAQPGRPDRQPQDGRGDRGAQGQGGVRPVRRAARAGRL